MIDFFQSTFTWKTNPWKRHPHYRWQGGFVGVFGQTYHVRFNLKASCVVEHVGSGVRNELFLGTDCRHEYTIAYENLFQVPSDEWRMAFSRTAHLHIAEKPSDEHEDAHAHKLSEEFQEHKITIREYPDADILEDARDIICATLDGELFNAQTTYSDNRGFRVILEYPVNLINIHEACNEFQVCTGPVILPDLDTWDGQDVRRVFIAHSAFSRFDRAEFILQQKVQASREVREWLDKPHGRDRLELWDSKNPTRNPIRRPLLTAYNEVWEVEAKNVLLSKKSIFPSAL
jgi:hypothetical protein